MPARQPDYTPLMVEGLQDQVIAILQRDFAANLAAINAAAGYPGINQYHKLLLDGNFENAPECIVEAAPTVVAQDEQGALSCQHVLTVAVVITAPSDSEDLAQQARDYARALVWTLARRWDLADYWQPLPLTYQGATRQTVGMPGGAVKEVSVRGVNWAMKGTLVQQIGRMPTIELGIQTEEM